MNVPSALPPELVWLSGLLLHPRKLILESKGLESILSTFADTLKKISSLPELDHWEKVEEPDGSRPALVLAVRMVPGASTPGTRPAPPPLH